MPIRLRVRELREAKGLNQSELARLANIPQPNLSDIELGKANGISFPVLERLADALGVDAALLIEHKRNR